MVQLGYSPNRDALLDVARALAPMLVDVVFVGGQVAELLITAPGATRVRPTDDVDIVVRAATKVEYRKVEELLTELGLNIDPEGPICRWKTKSGTKVDVMPVDESVLGFGSQWYPAAISQAVPYQLSDDLSILIPPAPIFLATKWDAFHSEEEGTCSGAMTWRISSLSWPVGRNWWPRLRQATRKYATGSRSERKNFLKQNSLITQFRVRCLILPPFLSS
jgi:hypothetical protein